MEKDNLNDENVPLPNDSHARIDENCTRIVENIEEVSELLEQFENVDMETDLLVPITLADKVVSGTRSSSRSYIFTNYDICAPEDYKWETMGIVRYAVWQLERCPSTGKLHHQGYVELSKPSKFTMVKKRFPGEGKKAWFGIRRATKRQARAYCMKPVSRAADLPKEQTGPFKWGFFDKNAPDGAAASGKKSRDQQIEELVKMLEEGRDRSWLMKNGYKRYVQDFVHIVTSYEKCKQSQTTVFAAKRVRLTVLQGEQGCGKSTNVVDVLASKGDAVAMKSSSQGRFFSGINDRTEFIVVDEFDSPRTHCRLRR